MKKKLTRNTQNQIIAGVFSGLADYTNQDATLYRVLAVVGLILTGFFPGVVLYVVAWVMIPVDTRPPADYEVFE